MKFKYLQAITMYYYANLIFFKMLQLLKFLQ